MRRGVRKIVIVLVAAMLVLLVAGIGGSVYARSRVAFPQPTGTYAVGRTDAHFVDRTRPDALGAEPSAPRELMVTIYYPAAPHPGAAHSDYAQGKLLSLTAADAHMPPFVLSLLARPHLYEDPPPMARAGGFPVLLFEPGWGVPPIFYTATLEDLASHGYVVAAIWPTDCIAFTLFPDGRGVTQTRQGEDPDKYTNQDAVALPVREKVGGVWTQDARFVLDRLAAMNDAPGRFRGLLDTERSGMFGHSFGGAIAAEAAVADPRVKAAANLDGSPVMEDRAPVPITKPLLMMRSTLPAPPADELARAHLTRAQFQAHEDATYRRLYATARPGEMVTLAGAGHDSYMSDVALLGRVPFSSNPDRVGTIDGLRAVRITDAWLVAFFDRTVAGRPTSDPAFPEAVAQRW